MCAKLIKFDGLTAISGVQRQTIQSANRITERSIINWYETLLKCEFSQKNNGKHIAYMFSENEQCYCRYCVIEMENM